MDSATKFRRAEIEMIKKNLENQLVHYYQTSAKFKRCYHSYRLWAGCFAFCGWRCCWRAFNRNCHLVFIGVNLLHGHHQIFPA